MPGHLYIYVDVDDTFVRSMGSKRIPIPSSIRHVQELFRQGAILYCWSSGGADYAKASAEEFGIAQCFVAFLPKPNILIDDQLVTEWPRFRTIHPNTCGSLSLTDYQARVDHGRLRQHDEELP